jgi:hypothetical protein
MKILHTIWDFAADPAFYGAVLIGFSCGMVMCAMVFLKSLTENM